MFPPTTAHLECPQVSPVEQLHLPRPAHAAAVQLGHHQLTQYSDYYLRFHVELGLAQTRIVDSSISYHHYPHQERRVHREKDEDRNFVGVNIYHGLVKEYTLHL